MPNKISSTGAEIALTDCKIYKLNIITGDPVEQGAEIQLENEIGVRRLDDERRMPIGIEVLQKINANNGDFFSIDLVARSFFAIPEDASFDEANWFMAKVAPVRSMDIIRSHVEEITSRCAFGRVPIPSITIDLDPNDWVCE